MGTCQYCCSNKKFKKRRNLTRDQVPRDLAGIEAVVLAGTEVNGGLLQNLLYSAKLGLGIVRVTGNNDGLTSHACSAQEKYVTVERSGHL